MGYYGPDIKMPLPRNKTELELLTKWYFGKPLHLSRLYVHGTSGAFEVKELHNSYHGEGWNFGVGDTRGYDYSARFWNAVIGERYCGGIAGSSYGQFNIKGHRNQQRLQALKDSIGRTGIDPVRPIFVRLAARRRGRREWRDSR